MIDNAMADNDSDHSPSQVAPRGPLSRGRFLFVDATGVLDGYGSAPSGIPRVEEFLVRAAAADNDPSVLLVKFDHRTKLYTSLDIIEQRLLRSDADIPLIDCKKGHLFGALWQAFRIIGQYPTIGRHVDREFAAIATNKGQGFAYQAARLLIRFYRWFRRLIAGLTTPSSNRSKPADLTNGVILLSNAAMLIAPFPATLDRKQQKAFICHDLIPLLYPHLAMGTEFIRRFSAGVTEVMQHDSVTALCTSETSLAMMNEHIQRSGLEPARVKRIRLPSILLERAERYQPQTRSAAQEPFILYCSTVEVRKNHLLLARIWQHALDEGLSLPKLMCVGKWGWGVDDLINYLSKRPVLADRIVFTGPASDEDLVYYYRNALFGVMPSHIEGWGYGASECLDFGIPVIVSNIPALLEATHGLMPAIDPTDEAGWFSEIRRLSESAEQRAWYREQIAERYRPVSTRASWTEIKSILRDE